MYGTRSSGTSPPLIEEPDIMESTDNGGKRRSPDPNAPIYGELVVLG